MIWRKCVGYNFHNQTVIVRNGSHLRCPLQLVLVSVGFWYQQVLSCLVLCDVLEYLQLFKNKTTSNFKF